MIHFIISSIVPIKKIYSPAWNEINRKREHFIFITLPEFLVDSSSTYITKYTNNISNISISKQIPTFDS